MALEGVGITAPFPIQSLALPVALGGHDIIGQARTGTGKTLAFGIPLLQHLADTPASEPTAPAALVVVPTRELASQVADDLRVASVALGTRVLTVYGGRAYEPQIDALRKGVDIVVGTPGRLLDLVGQRHLKPVRGPRPGAGRGGQDARPRVPPGRGADPGTHPGRAADHAVLRHHAG